MSKNFFVVVSYTPGKISMGRGIGTFFSPGSSNSSTPTDTVFEENRTQLEQRLSLVTEGLARIGVRTIPLGKDELVELFYHIFNPADQTGTAPQIDN
jgi:hypothetical protein